MEHFDALIIGGSAAGIPAATTARRHYPDAKVGILRQEEKVLVPCGIPYIFGTLGSPEKNLIPDQAATASGATLLVSEVTSLDPVGRANPSPADGLTDAVWQSPAVLHDLRTEHAPALVLRQASGTLQVQNSEAESAPPALFRRSELIGRYEDLRRIATGGPCI